MQVEAFDGAPVVQIALGAANATGRDAIFREQAGRKTFKYALKLKNSQHFVHGTLIFGNEAWYLYCSKNYNGFALRAPMFIPMNSRVVYPDEDAAIPASFLLEQTSSDVLMFITTDVQASRKRILRFRAGFLKANPRNHFVLVTFDASSKTRREKIVVDSVALDVELQEVVVAG